jgi:hypothetical protein
MLSSNILVILKPVKGACSMIRLGIIIASVLLICSAAAARDTLFVWVGGSFSGSVWNNTIIADTGQWLDIPVYLAGGTPQVYVADICFPMGIHKSVVDSFKIEGCQIFAPFNQWDNAYFGNFNNEFQGGWASLSFVGLSRITPPYDNNPPFHSNTPVLGFSVRVHVAPDASLLNRTIYDAFGAGLDPVQGLANAGDTIGTGTGYTVFQRFACLRLGTSGCSYVTGDANNSGTWTGQDVTYSVRFFKGGNPPPYSCECTPGHTWYVSGDVNGSCSFSGQDVTYMVRHFKTGVPAIVCADCPPGGLLAPPAPRGLPTPTVHPIIKPTLKTKVVIKASD